MENWFQKVLESLFKNEILAEQSSTIRIQIGNWHELEEGLTHGELDIIFLQKIFSQISSPVEDYLMKSFALFLVTI